MRGANSSFEILNLGLQEYFRSRIASGRSNSAFLGELGNNLLPLFPIKRQKGVVRRVADPPGYAFQLFWVKKNCFCEENQSQGSFVTLPRCFRKQIRKGFPPFFIRSSSVLRSSTGKFPNPRLLIHFLFFGFHLYFVQFRFLFFRF